MQILELDGRVPVGHYVYFPHPAIMGDLEGNKTPFIRPLAAVINRMIRASYGLLKAKRDYPLAAANLLGIIFGLLATVTAF